MVRVLLILCYFLATVGGPRPCCCATAHAAPPVQPKAKAAPPAKRCPRCPVAPAPEPKPEKRPPAKKHSCPCPKVVAAASATPRIADDARPHTSAPDTPPTLALVVVPLARGAVSPAVGSPPHPSPHLLALTHRLRC